MIQRNQIPHLKMGKSVRIRESDLVAWLDEQIVPKNELVYPWNPPLSYYLISLNEGFPFI